MLIIIYVSRKEAKTSEIKTADNGNKFYKMQKMAGTIIPAKAKQNAEDYNCKPRLNEILQCSSAFCIRHKCKATPPSLIFFNFSLQ